MKIISAAEARKLGPGTDRLLLAVDNAIRSAAVSGHAKAEITSLLPPGWETNAPRTAEPIEVLKAALEKSGFRYESKVGGPDGRAFARVYW